MILAGHVLRKVYVDYQNVNEWDAHRLNWIRQRATVEYVNGTQAQSADQWFQAGLILTPINVHK
jgi:hypothetical protein